MATTTTTNNNSAPGLVQRTALGILSSLPTTTPALKVIQKALPHLPNLQNLGNGLSSAMTATQPAGTGAQNSNANQSNMCDVGRPNNAFLFLAHPSFFRTAIHTPSGSTQPLVCCTSIAQGPARRQAVLLIARYRFPVGHPSVVSLIGFSPPFFFLLFFL